jgi:tRNA (cmo5U34)-methyltransferase
MPKASATAPPTSITEDFPGSESIPTEHDSIFRSENGTREDFRFDESVAKVLPDMLRRSIPGYAALLQLIGVLAGAKVVEGARVYDLGCSLGAVSLSIRHALGARNATIVAVDQSAAMVERCRNAIDADSALCPVDVLVGDIRDFQFSPCSFVVLNFTLQFVEKEQRSVILERIARALVPGGILVISEKTTAHDERHDKFFAQTHDAFRRENGYSQIEISRKREALERVLVPETPEYTLALLRTSGLEPIEWFRSLYFVSWVATKPKA